MYSHGAHALFHWVFRSVAREAVHSSPVPILVLKESDSSSLEPHRDQFLRMLVPLAGPGRGEMHLVQVIDLPSIEGKPILRAYELKKGQEQAVQEARDYLAGMTYRLFESLPADSQIAITWSIMMSNHVSRTIVEMTKHLGEGEQESRYDLLAMATHGRTGLQLLRLGSVTEHVLGATGLPLLVVRPHQPASQQKQEAERELVEK